MASGNRTITFAAVARDPFGTEVSRTLVHLLDSATAGLSDEHVTEIIKTMEGKYVQPKTVPHYIELEYLDG